MGWVVTKYQIASIINSGGVNNVTWSADKILTPAEKAQFPAIPVTFNYTDYKVGIETAWRDIFSTSRATDWSALTVAFANMVWYSLGGITNQVLPAASGCYMDTYKASGPGMGRFNYAMDIGFTPYTHGFFVRFMLEAVYIKRIQHYDVKIENASQPLCSLKETAFTKISGFRKYTL